MKKYVILSVDQNPDYRFFTPITQWAWRQFGWETILLDAQKVDGYRDATVAQISRLYAACILSEDDMIMTGDIDMLPLSDYWHPKNGDKTVYGYDLTGHKEFPICYIAMRGSDWRKVMSLEPSAGINFHMKRDLDAMPNAKSDDFYKWWGVDQQLITERLKPYNPAQILRGQYANGLAVGRVDRANWSLSHSQLIDAHLFHQLHHRNNQDKFEKVIELLYHVWPKENFDWFISYYLEYQKLTGHA